MVSPLLDPVVAAKIKFTDDLHLYVAEEDQPPAALGLTYTAPEQRAADHPKATKLQELERKHGEWIQEFFHLSHDWAHHHPNMNNDNKQQQQQHDASPPTAVAADIIMKKRDEIHKQLRANWTAMEPHRPKTIYHRNQILNEQGTNVWMKNE